MTHLILSEKSLLKTDAKGRVKTPAERRESLVDEFERSGLSGAKFAQLAGLKYQTFATWVARWRKERAKGSVPINQKLPCSGLKRSLPHLLPLLRQHRCQCGFRWHATHYLPADL